MNSQILNKTKSHFLKTFEKGRFVYPYLPRHIAEVERWAEKEWILGNLERDHRDVGIFPELKREITPLYKAWKKLLTVYPNKI